MGFHFEPTIVWPHTAYREPVTDDLFSEAPPSPRVPHELRVWLPHESLRLGHTTRVEKLDIPHIAEGIGPHERAVICFSSVIVNGIYDSLEQIFSGKDPRELVAPPFLIHRPGGDWLRPRSLENQLDEVLLDHPGASSAIDLGSRGCAQHELFPWPGTQAMADHNWALNLSAKALTHRLQTNHFILYSPVLWASMKNVDEWFAKAESEESPQWRHSRSNPASAAQYQAWRSWVGALAETEARMLFVFPLY